MEPITNVDDGNDDPPPSHAARQRRPKFPNMVVVPLLKKATVEFLGTFILMFTQVSAIIMDEQHDGVEGLMGVAVFVGLAVTVLVFSTIHVSGCHLNPAASIAIAAFSYLPPAHLVPYVAAQVLGSTAASFVVGNAIYHRVNPGIATVPSVGAVEAFAVEFIITFVLICRKLGLSICKAAGTCAAYNKIWVYLLATPLGAIAGAGSYVAIKL
ncbi:hypothetical protein VPH35_045907 [Triticum aestivum]